MTRSIEIKINWILWLILLVPTFYVAGVDLRTAQANLFSLCAMFVIGLLLPNKYFGLLVMYSVLQYCLFPALPVSSFQLQALAFGAVMYYLIVKYADPKQVKTYLWAFLGILVFNCFWALLQAWNLDFIFTQTDIDRHPDPMTEYAGFFALPAFLGNYAAAVAPICFLIMPWLLGFVGIALILSKSTFSAIAIFCSILFFLWFRKRLYFWICLAVGLISVSSYIICSDMPSGQFGRRFAAWKVIAREASMKQFIGHGLGSLSSTYLFTEVTPTHAVKMVNNPGELLDFIKGEATKIGKQDVAALVDSQDRHSVNATLLSKEMQNRNMDFHIWKECHNEYLQIFFELGGLGLLLVGLYICDLFKRFYRYGRDNIFCVAMASCALAIFVVCIGHFPFHVARLAMPFLILLALFDASLLKIQEEITQ